MTLNLIPHKARRDYRALLRRDAASQLWVTRLMVDSTKKTGPMVTVKRQNISKTKGKE